MADREKTIPLEFPVDMNGVGFATVTLRRAKVKDLVAAQEEGVSQAQQEVNLAARLSGLKPEDILEIDGSDYAKI